MQREGENWENELGSLELQEPKLNVSKGAGVREAPSRAGRTWLVDTN